MERKSKFEREGGEEMEREREREYVRMSVRVRARVRACVRERDKNFIEDVDGAVIDFHSVV